MNVVAARLGMKNTIFKNSTGWPHPEITTTARDLNILATALIRDFPVSEYPNFIRYFAKITYTLNEIKQGNRIRYYMSKCGRNGADVV